MWQSWDLRFVNFFSFIFILSYIFQEYPEGTFILFKQSNMLSFSSLLRVLFTLVTDRFWPLIWAKNMRTNISCLHICPK
jgi:hypothetical protein